MKNNKPIIVVMGEPFSIFSEIFFKSLKSKKFLNYKRPLILVGSKDLIKKQMKKLKFFLKINVIDKNNFKNNIDNKVINLINVNFFFKKTFDKISKKSSKYITKCFEISLKLMKNKKGFALINGPISKHSFLNKKFLGITEYLAHKTNKNKKEVMLIYSKKLSVSPITTHLPLKDVQKNISKKKIINNVITINDFYKNKLKKKPRFAVTGLNPHCETIHKISEENTIIKPSINFLRKKNINIKGPYSADTLFIKKNLKNYDVIIGMYHDQVLTPIKTLYGFHAINITLGLPFIRISPDHGTNNKMIGKNISDPQSLLEALFF